MSIRIVDMPDLGTVTDDSSVVGEHAGSGRFSASALRSYIATSSNYVSKAGDTMSGSLAVTGDIHATDSFTATTINANTIGAPIVSATTVGATTVDATTVNAATVNATNVAATGTVSGAAVSTGGTVTGGTVTSTGDITGAGTVTGGTLHSLSDTNVGNSLVAAKNVHAQGDVNFFMGSPGANLRSVNFAAGGYGWLYSTLDASLQYNAAGAFWVMRSDGVCYNERGYVAGHGAYVDLSDERAKLAVADATEGLDVICRLRPISFKRIAVKPIHHPMAMSVREREVGFSAQAVQEVLPEAVLPLGFTLPDGSGGPDSANPSLGVSTTPIIAALVNSCKELSARIKALEAKTSASEAK